MSRVVKVRGGVNVSRSEGERVIGFGYGVWLWGLVIGSGYRSK